MKNNFKKWIALFLSVAMVAVSGITTNTSFLAAEYTEGQETTAGEEQSAVTETPASTETQESTETPEVTTAPTQETTETSDAENNADENSTEKTQVVDLDTTTITPTPTEAPTPTEEAGDKEEKQEEDQREPYTTSAEGVTVTANLGDQPDILPKNTQFVVTSVTDSTTGYNYDSYLQALNSNVGVDNNNPVYTSANTHFYDLAFLDVTKNMEVEPQGSVSISMQFAEPLSKEFGVASDSQVQIFHLKNTGNSKYKSNETGTISVENINSNNLSAGSSYAEFSLDSFSVIAVSVDPYITGDTDTSTNYQTVLGNAVDFGITTGTFTLEGGDAETNVAAKVAKCTSQTGNDMTNDVEQTFILPEIDQGFNIKGPDNAAASLSNDVYVRTTSDNKSKITALDSVRLHIDDSETKEQLQAEVQAMLDHGESQSTQSLASHEATAKVVYGSDQKYKLDIRRGDAGTYYVNVDKSTLDGIQEADKLQIYKKNNQTVVFNVSSSDVTLWKFSVNNNGSDSLTGIKDDQYSSSIIWNLPNAKSVELRAIIGVVLAPKAAVKVAGTSAGWIVSSGVEIGSGEWHNIYRSVKKLRTEVSVSKKWEPSVPDKAEVDFTLYRNEKPTGKVITLDGTVDDNGETEPWKATFSNLPKCDTNGKDYNYTVRETDVRNADGFAASVSEANNGGTITNKKQATIDVSVSKEWDPTAPDKAEVEFTLYCNGDSTGKTITLDGTPDNNGETEAWKATFSNLPKCDADGQEYSYTVKETAVKNADGYTISGEEVENGGTITNTTDTSSAIIIRGTKTLANGTMTAGQFRFDLFENGKKIDTAANDADGKFTFAKIIYNPDDVSAGQTVTHTYTIKEENGGRTINGIRYSSEEKTVTVSVSKDKDGRMTVTSEGGTGSDSSFVNEKLRNLTVHKRWNDNNDEAGVRPSSITVDLQKGNTVVARAVLSESNGWSYTFTDLPYETYTVVEEEIGVDGYQAENGGIVVADTGTDAVTLVNDYNHPAVDIIANKVLTGATLTNGEFMFQLHRNSDPAGVITATAANNAAGEIIFSNIPYDPNGYTVTEVAGDDESITYDTEPVTFSAECVVTSSDHPEFRNTYRPILLRVQKRSKEAPYDPLVGATYGLYQVVEGGNDILVESEISDENGYMYYGRIQPGVIYYFKEIAAPAGHEVDPYPGQKFQVKYTSNGQIALYDENGNPTTVGDITGQDSKNLLVQYTTEKTAVDTSSSLSYSDDSIVAVAKADNSKAFPAGTKLKVTQLSGSEAKTAAAAVEAACGKINSNIAYYDIQFIDASGNEVEPAGGDVTVTIQYKGNLDLPEGTDRTALKLVHLTKEANGETTVEAVPGTVAADQDGLLQTSFTADSFSTFGVVEPGSDNTLGQNYLVTAAGVADQVSELKVAKLDTAGKYIKGAKLQIIEKATGNVMAEWNTADGPQSFARWFDDAKTVPMNVDTYYILHEVSAPDGYQLADDILFMINKYDSSITVYKYDDNGKLVIDQEAIDKWVSDTTLQMIDVPVKHETVTLVKQKLVPNEKTIQGEDKIVQVTSIKAVKTGDTSPIAFFTILLAAVAVVLLILVYRGRKKKDS